MTPKSEVIVGPKRRKNQSEVWDHFEKLKQGTYVLPEDEITKRGSARVAILS